jgi:uncharacterized iron-regulated membrane protein
MMRRLFVWLHRCVGLTLAGFLILEGLTGSLLTFNDELERLINPRFFAAPRPDVARLDFVELANRASESVPQGRVSGIFLGPARNMVYFRPRENPATGQTQVLDFDQFFLDPWTGDELGRRHWGDLSEGIVNLMPFVYRLHTNLALRPFGTLALGLVALVWTLDCFVGLYLTLPLTFAGFWRRWKRAWLIRRRGSAFRLNFDLHRAGGLWLWPLLLVFAWSSVLFNLHSVYEWTMHAALVYNAPDAAPQAPTHRVETPRLDWQAARTTAGRLMAEQAAERGFTVVRPTGLSYNAETGTYMYFVESSRDLSERYPVTSVTFDGSTGAFLSIELPNRQHSGDVADAWLKCLHRAEVFGLPYRVAVGAFGLVIVLLSVTGIYIWWKKRKARNFSASRTHRSPRTSPVA